MMRMRMVRERREERRNRVWEVGVMGRTGMGGGCLVVGVDLISSWRRARIWRLAEDEHLRC